MQVQLDIFKPLKLLEAQNGKEYTIKEVARKTGLHRHTITALMSGRDDTTLAKLLDFFHAEGMPITPNDLFVVEDSPSE